MISDTIAAIATAPGAAAVAVVRMSGSEASAIMAQIFDHPAFSLSSQMEQVESHRMYYGYITGVDEVMCCLMRAPRSYTREDIVEIYCHGGNSVYAVLAKLLEYGARPAEPGEFTKRAFMNGRIDLSQAEAVIEMLNANTELARRAVLRKLSGGLSRKIVEARDSILTWLAHIELSIDYPEHEEEAMNMAMVKAGATKVIGQLEGLVATSKLGERITKGVPTVIVGRPNVGKSSLMNAILQEERAIVTDIPGTTRDTLSEEINLRNVPILLTDTAGIRDSDDKVEQIGVERSKESAKNAELVLHVIDRSVALTDEDYKIAEFLEKEGQQRIVVVNKCDLPKQAEGFGGHLSEVEIVEVSAKTGEGFEKLYRLIEEMFLEGGISADGDIITRARHVHLLNETIRHLRAALETIEKCMPEDILAIDLKAAYVFLGEMLGEAVGDDVIDRIFEEFCVGK